MSAIAALWHAGHAGGAPPDVSAMLAALARYGPDGIDMLRSSEAAIGRVLCRLLPEDTFDRQPLVGADGRFHLVADVRLDNRAEIAAALGIDAAQLAQAADSDLLLAAWERWGVDLFARLVGDYAFAVFDSHRRELVIARDPFGGRPLLWTRNSQRVAVASMATGLFALPDVERAPDVERCALHFAGLDAGPRSFFADIQRVEPGHFVRFTTGGTEVRRHWNPTSRQLRLRSFPDYVDAYREQLDRAVSAQLRRVERPIAAHLSGGWDSGAVAATAARLLPSERLSAYTSVPAAGQDSSERTRFHDEGPLATQVAELYPNIDHILVPGNARSPLNVLAIQNDLFGQPLSKICNYVWFAEIRARARASGARVVLTGQMGNSTISNAPISMLADFVRDGRWRAWIREASATVRTGRGRVRGVIASSFQPWIPRAVWTWLQRFALRPSLDFSLLAPAWQERFADRLANEDRQRLQRNFYSNTLAFLRSVDVGEYNKGVLGGWGIDERDPTADVRLAEFMLSLPPDMFFGNGMRRPLARAALSDRLPPAVLDEKRKGYQAPDWHVGLTAHLDEVRDLVDRIAADPMAASVLDVKEMRRLVDNWPSDNWNDPAIVVRYRLVLLSALSTGSFLLHG